MSEVHQDDALSTGVLVLQGRARSVVLFEDRAEVTRDAEVQLEEGTMWAAIGGVSPFIDAPSVQARTQGGGDAQRVLSARVRWRAHTERALGGDAIEALEQEEKAAERALRTHELALDRASRADHRAKVLLAKWLEGVALVPRGAQAEASLASFRAAFGTIEARAKRALDEMATAREARQRATDALAVARARLVEGRVERPRYEAIIEVQIASREACKITLEVTYRVPCALWRPEHVLRIAAVPPSGGTAPLEIVTLATAWQCTGEAWDDVAVRFSTARPARAAAPPTLSDDTLRSRRKTEQERRVIEIDLREQAVMLAGLDRGTSATSEMPGVDDGGEPVLLAPRDKVSIASDGRPFRVEVQRITTEAVIERVLFSERSHVAHLRATATLTKGGPLLAGPLRIVRGQSRVGLGRIAYVGKGEPFEVGLGTDDGVRARRSATTQRDVVPITGTQKIKRAIKIYVSNLSNEPKRVLLAERIPVSEIGDIEITLTEKSGFELDAKDGLMRRTLDLGPHAMETIELGYELRASAKVSLPRGSAMP